MRKIISMGARLYSVEEVMERFRALGDAYITRFLEGLDFSLVRSKAQALRRFDTVTQIGDRLRQLHRWSEFHEGFPVLVDALESSLQHVSGLGRVLAFSKRFLRDKGAQKASISDRCESELAELRRGMIRHNNDAVRVLDYRSSLILGQSDSGLVDALCRGDDQLGGVFRTSEESEYLYEIPRVGRVPLYFKLAEASGDYSIGRRKGTKLCLDEVVGERFFLKYSMMDSQASPSAIASVRDEVVREAGMLRRVQGDFVPKLIGEGSFILQHMLVTEVVSRPEGLVASFDDERTSTYIKGMLNALTFIHDRGVFHRNVSPPTVLVDESGRTKLVGFSYATEDETSREIGMGTPGFAPLQLSFGDVLEAPYSCRHIDEIGAAAVVFDIFGEGRLVPIPRPGFRSLDNYRELQRRLLQKINTLKSEKARALIRSLMRVAGYPKGFQNAWEEALKDLAKFQPEETGQVVETPEKDPYSDVAWGKKVDLANREEAEQYVESQLQAYGGLPSSTNTLEETMTQRRRARLRMLSSVLRDAEQVNGVLKYVSVAYAVDVYEFFDTEGSVFYFNFLSEKNKKGIGEVRLFQDLISGDQLYIKTLAKREGVSEFDGYVNVTTGSWSRERWAVYKRST